MLSACVAHALGVRFSTLHELAGVVPPVMNDYPAVVCAVEEASPATDAALQQCEHPCFGIALPRGGVGNVGGIEAREVSVVSVVKRPMPEGVQMPHDMHGGHVERSRQPARLGMAEQGLMTLDVGHQRPRNALYGGYGVLE